MGEVQQEGVALPRREGDGGAAETRPTLQELQVGASSGVLGKVKCKLT